MTDFCFVDGQETVRDIFNLLEGLTAASYLKEIFVVDVEVTFLGVLDFVADA